MGAARLGCLVAAIVASASCLAGEAHEHATPNRFEVLDSALSPTTPRRGAVEPMVLRATLKAKQPVGGFSVRGGLQPSGTAKTSGTPCADPAPAIFRDGFE